MTRRFPTLPNAAETALAEQFSADEGASTALERQAAFRRFAAQGLPTRRDESWHYTDLRALFPGVAPLARAPGAAEIAAAREALARRPRLAPARIVLLDGFHIAELSDAAPGVRISTHALGARVAGDSDPMLSLNSAMARGGVALSVAPDSGGEPRVEILHLVGDGAAKSVYSRVSIEIGAGSGARVIENFAGARPGDQRNAATFIELGAGARLRHAVSIEDSCGLHIETQTIRLGEGASLTAFALVAGGTLARRQIFAALEGERAEIALGGLSLLDGARHADTTLVVDHAAPRGKSREYYRHIVDGAATGVYQGKVVVRPGAQKTDGGMKSQAILLSPSATMDNKPELEIFADDVVCGHGATVGALDPEQLFYLGARGLPRAEAQAMLLEAFGAEAIGHLEDEDWIEALRGVMSHWLAGRTVGDARR